MSAKTDTGNFFEDFKVGQELHHATPRTVTEGDIALYTALYGGRFACHSSSVAARRLGFPAGPVDDLLAFHLVFGKTVPDISLNAIANLGYAEGRFPAPLYPGDTVSAVSTVIGTKANSNGQSGVVYVHTVGRKQTGEIVVDYKRWVMVRTRAPLAEAPAPDVPTLPDVIDPASLTVPNQLDFSKVDFVETGSRFRWNDYAIGEKIDHVDGMTIEAAEHMMATRLYQNTAKVHFNLHTEGQGRLKERIVYGGHVISLCRSLSYNGLQNALFIAGINGGRHIAPCIAGDTVYAWSEVLDKAKIPGRKDVGALRLRLVGLKNRAGRDFPYRDGDAFAEGVVLDLDYWVLMPRA